MEKIVLENIKINDRDIEYGFSYTYGLDKYFSKRPFVIHYPECVETVPFAVLAIPFILNVLPIVWLTDSVLTVPEMDRDLYNALPKLKKGYMDMYPESSWRGKVEADRIIDCSRSDASGPAAFFSGGLDATTTLLLHYDEKPELLVLWGSDVKYDNVEGWEVMHKGLLEVAQLHDLPLFSIRTAFREFDNEGKLHADFSPILKDGWWHGVKHSIAIIGHAAPLMWLHKRKTVYIASSFTAKDIGVRCASYPTIDESVAFFGCKVVHDGFQFDRQEKAHYVVKRKKELNLPILLKVCWETQTGNNCCKCEKCYRTMVGLYVEGEDPSNYGFIYDKNTIFEDIYDFVAMTHKFSPGALNDWKKIKSGFILNFDLIKDTPYGQKLNWIKDFDFEDIENNPSRKAYAKKLKHISRKERAAALFPGVYKFYTKIMKRS